MNDNMTGAGHITFNGNTLSMIKKTLQNSFTENPGHVTFGKNNEL